MHGRLTRRRVLSALAATTTVGLAGCLGDDDPTPTATPSPTPVAPVPDPAVADAAETAATAFVEDLVAHDFEAAAAAVAPAYTDELDADELETAWTDTEAKRESVLTVYLAQFHGDSPSGRLVQVLVGFTDGPQEVLVTLSDDDEVLGLLLPTMPEWSPPAYVDAGGFETEPVTVETDIGCDLGGVAAVPSDDAAVPGVVLVHGSGPSDRDGTTGPNRTYRELAEGLASAGVATLRYDKRSYACDIDLAAADIDDVVTDDAVAAIERLGAIEGVDGSRIAVVGHSLGGMLAPRIATAAGGVAGVALLAPAARSIDELLIDQQEHLLSLDDSVGEAEAEAHMDAVEDVAEQIRELDIEDDETINDMGGRAYFASLQEYDHLSAVADLEVPVALLQGGRDWQVTVEDDLPLWEDALSAHDDHEVHVYDDLNHRFQESDGPMTAEEYAQPDSPVAADVIDDLAAFVAGIEG